MNINLLTIPIEFSTHFGGVDFQQKKTHTFETPWT